MKSLLTIINNPEDSKNIIKYAVNLAKDLNKNVFCLYVQNPDNYPIGTQASSATGLMHVENNLQTMLEKTNKTIRNNIEDIQKNVKGEVTVKYISEIGITSFIAEEIVAEQKADMLILEESEHHSIWTYNPNIMDFIKKFDIPIWVIPKEINYNKHKKIVYATDYNEKDIYTLNKLIELTSNYSPEITTLHISENEEFEDKIKKSGFIDMVKKNTGYDNITIKTLLEGSDENLAQLINDYSQNIQASLIVVLKENKQFLDRLFSSSSTKKIINQAQLPVLIFHEQS